MKQYIDKDKLEEFLNELRENLGDSDYDRGYLCAIDSIFGCYLNSLEVKEVDLEKEIGNVWNPRFNLGWDEKSLLSVNHEGFTTIAKHFFELGLNASNPLTLEDIKEICVQSVLVEIDLGGKVSDERHYTEVLKRFKALKGEEV